MVREAEQQRIFEEFPNEIQLSFALKEAIYNSKNRCNHTTRKKNMGFD
jgi:hypothetical protein